MKLLCWLFFGIAITSELQGQNCKALDSKLFFHSIKYGAQIPKAVIACSGKSKPESANLANLRIEYASLNNVCKKKYSDLFTFLSVSFSFSQIATNNKGQIYSLELYSFFNDNRSSNSMPYAPPANFITIYNKLKSLYGEPARIEEATSTDSLFIKDLGMPRLVIWECENTILQLRVRYGARVKELNVLDVQVTKRDFEPIPAEEQILQ